MLKGTNDKVIALREVMHEEDMTLYLLKNGYDLGEGECEKGQEHLYVADSAKIMEEATELGYEAKMNEHNQNIFTNAKMIGTGRKCNRCESQVEFETELDYPYYCPDCYENLYEIETDELTVQPTLSA